MLIKINNLNKSYYNETKTITRALENINLEFRDKGLNFIVGESGSGKTTLLNVIGGIDTFDSGSLVVGGYSLKDMTGSKLDYYRNSVIGLIFQELNLLEEFNVRENIKLALDLNNKKDEKKIDNMLIALGIKEIEYNNIKNISTGQKQRVAIARTLIKNPSIIIADEPTGSLDSKNAQEIMGILKEISKVKLVIVITHDREFASYYGDRIIELKDGQVVKDIEKGSSKDKNVKILSSNLIKINKLDELVVNKINEIRQEYNQKVYVSSDTNTRKTKSLFPKAILDKNDENGDFKVKQRIKEKMNDVKIEKSKLRIGCLFKISLSNLFNKKKILIMTILLMIFSLTLYGISEGIANYSKIDSYIETIKEENLKTINLVEKNGDVSKRIREESVTTLKENHKNISIAKEYYLPLRINFNKTINGTKKYNLNGISEVNDISKFGYKVICGASLLNDFNEIIISEYFANLLIEGAYFENVNGIDNLIDKQIKLNEFSYKIVGIIESDYLAKYDKEEDKLNSYLDIRDNLIFVKEGFIKDYLKKLQYIPYFLDIYLKDNEGIYDENDLAIANVVFDSNNDTNEFVYSYFDESKTSLLGNEILVSESYLENNDMCLEGCTINSFANNEFVITHESSILYSSSDYKVVGTYSYEGTNNNLYNLYNNSIVISSSIKENIGENIYYNNQLLIGLSSNDWENENFIKHAYDIGLSINKNFTSMYDNYSEMIIGLSDILNSLSIILLGISIILLFIFIQNSIFISQRKIGILKSLGVRDFSVFLMFFLEAMFVALFSIIGSNVLLLITAPIINLIVTSNYGFYFSCFNIDLIILLKIGLLTLIVSFIALLVPLLRFKKMNTNKLIGSR